MIHITVNVPGFSSVMNIRSNINDDFKAQGFANLAAGIFGFQLIPLIVHRFVSIDLVTLLNFMLYSVEFLL